MRLLKSEKKKLNELRHKHSKEEALVDSFIKGALNDLKNFAVIKEEEEF